MFNKIKKCVISLILFLGGVTLLNSCDFNFGGIVNSSSESNNVSSNTNSSIISSNSETLNSSLNSSENQIEKCNVIFYFDNNTIIKTVDKGTILNNVPSPGKKDGYTLSWNYDFSEPITDDVQCEIVYTLIEYNITYHLPEGIENTNDVFKYTIETKSFSLKPLDNMDSLVFEGWYDSDDFESANKISVIKKGTIGDISLYPKFVNLYSLDIINFEVDLENYEYPCFVSNLKYASNYYDFTNQVIIDSSCSFVVSSDSSFENVYSKNVVELKEGNNIGYIKVYDDSSYKIYMYDIFVDTKYIYRFIGDDLTLYTEGTVLNGTIINKCNIEPTKSGYEFIGWKLSNDTSNQVVTFPYLVNSNVTFVPIWKVINYTITYNLKGGTNHPDNIKTFTIEDSFEIKDPTHNRKEFLGWYINEQCTVLADTYYTEHSENIVLYAKWDEVKVNVTFELNYNNLGSYGSRYNYSQGIIENKVVDPSRDQYTFTGWYLDKDCTVYFDPANYILTSDITLYAGWIYSGIASYTDYEGDAGFEQIDGTILYNEPESEPFVLPDGASYEAPTSGYALLITPLEGDRYYFALTQGEEFDGFVEYYAMNVTLNEGDLITLYNCIYLNEWVEDNLNSYSVEGFSVDETKGIVCEISDTYDVYVKFKFEQNEIYIGPAGV